MRKSRRLAAAALLAIGVGALVGVPASADDSLITVSLQGTSGSRQFYVENLTGDALTALDLGHGGSQPFRVRVTDTTFGTTSSGFQVSAVMGNLYLAAGNGYTYSVKIPSSSVALSFPTTPLTSLGVSFPYVPTLSLSGTIPSCASLAAANPGVLGSIATTAAAIPLCTLLGASGTAVSNVSLTGVAQTVTPTVGSILDLPTQLAGTGSGAFTNADYANGIGAGDSAGASGAPSATSRSVMTGTPSISATLAAAIAAAFNGKPLTAANDTGSLAPVADVVAALQASSTASIAALGNAIALLGSAAQESAVVNVLTKTLAAANLAGIQSLTGSYVAFPSLVSTPSAPAPGTYKGTLTLTFVQT